MAGADYYRQPPDALREDQRRYAEIDRLRSALQEIYDDGIPYAYGKAAKALGITPPPMP